MKAKSINPQPKCYNNQSIVKSTIPSPTQDIRDVVIHALIARIAYTDDSNQEFLITLNDAHTLDLTIPRINLDQLIDQVNVGTKVQDYIDWLSGKRISSIEQQLNNLPIASKTIYGIVKIGDGIEVADGIISVTTTEGWQTVVTDTNYTVSHNPTRVICTDALNVTMPASPNTGYEVIIKNATSDKDVNIVGTLDGNINPQLGPYEAAALVYNGTDWSII